jgi:hypothetical protein
MKRISLIFLATILAGAAFGQKEKIQSSYIYNFTNYISWPESSKSGDFIVGVIGSGPLLNELNTLAATKKVITQTIVVKQMGSVSDIDKCQVLIITESKSSQLQEALAKIGNDPTLVITESPGLATKGAGINFVVKDGKMLFELNKARIEKRGLKINSKLTALALLVD